jgi:hypothetical protein
MKTTPLIAGIFDNYDAANDARIDFLIMGLSDGDIEINVAEPNSNAMSRFLHHAGATDTQVQYYEKAIVGDKALLTVHHAENGISILQELSKRGADCKGNELHPISTPISQPPEILQIEPPIAPLWERLWTFGLKTA